MQPFRHPLGRPIVLVAMLTMSFAPGCVRRRMLIRSNPPGAFVYVDNQPIGVTPCSTDFTYYGTREFRLVKPGFETLTINQPLPAPWYELPPLDFVSENLVPREIQDYRTLSFDLKPQVIKPNDQLLAEAQALRQYAEQGAVTPAGAIGAPTALGAAAQIGPPTFVAPGLPPADNTPSADESIAPGLLMPPTSSAGTLPPGGRALQPLPTPVD